MDVSFDSVDSVYESFDWTYDLTNLQYEPTNRECDLTDYDPYVSTASICAQTETFDPVDSVYQSMDWPYGLTGLQCEPTSFSYTPTDSEHDLKDFGSYAPTKEPFEQTEGKAWRLLAARIPQELFDDILFYVNVDRVSQRHEGLRKYGRDLIRNRGEPSAKNILTDLKRCSLVCLFWANRCRQHMFSATTLEIRNYEDAKIFRRYVVGGCPRLTPVQQLISKLDVTQNYNERSSFLDLLYLPAIQDKLKSLTILGPVPVDFNPAKLDTPHWGIPPFIVVPSSFMREIVLKNVHFPSFRHVTKYMRHFTCATYIYFEGITWDVQTPTYSLPHAFSPIPGQRRPRSLIINSWNGCTDSVHLALTALMLNPNCPLHRLSDEECVWMIKFMTLLCGHKKDPYVDIGFDVSEQTTTMELYYHFHFVFEEAPPTDRSTSALTVVGMHAYIDDLRQLPANLDALVNHARTQPTTCALVLLFDSLDRLHKAMKPLVLGPSTETIKLVLAYEKEHKLEAVGVDLVTLKPSGRIWADLQAGWIRNKSLEILRRELKKRR